MKKGPICPHPSDRAILCCVCELNALLFQERLEKEKKLSKDLGQAATKLQQLLKATQEQLTKERDAVRTLQEHLEGKVRHETFGFQVVTPRSTCCSVVNVESV